jgi:Tat protein translocase TatB subunit
MLLGAGEIVVVLAVALMVLGPKKMPEVARKLALLVAQFRRMADEVRSQVDDALNEPPPTPKLPADAQTPPTPPPSANAPSGAPVNPGSGGAHDGPDPS